MRIQREVQGQSQRVRETETNPKHNPVGNVQRAEMGSRAKGRVSMSTMQGAGRRQGSRDKQWVRNERSGIR